MLKTTDKIAVLIVACDLMKQNGQTTTLEVKNELRNQGYDARQMQVSQFMSELAGEEGWPSVDSQTTGITNLPNHLIYSPGTSGLATAPVPSSSSKTTTWTFTSGVIGDWEVNSVTNSTVIFVSGVVTREQARQAYLNAVPGTKWADTRSRRVR